MEYNKNRKREILISVCRQTGGVPQAMEYDYAILSYTLESVSPEATDAVKYYLI